MTDAEPLQRGDLVPHVEVVTVDGGRFAYQDIWQHRNLVLVALPQDATADEAAYVASLSSHHADFLDLNSACIVTRDRVPGVPVPGAIVADRWGAIVHVAAPATVAGLPTASDLLEWLQFVQRRCAG